MGSISKFWCRQFLNAQFEKVKNGTYQKRPHDNEVSLLFGPDTGIVKFLGTKEVGKVRPRVADTFNEREGSGDSSSEMTFRRDVGWWFCRTIVAHTCWGFT